MKLKILSICVVKFEVVNFLSICLQILELLTNGLHKKGAHTYSNLVCAPFYAKKYGTGWMDEWMDGRAGLRTAYSNQKLYFNKKLVDINY